jgi:hypothetical protein
MQVPGGVKLCGRVYAVWLAEQHDIARPKRMAVGEHIRSGRHMLYNGNSVIYHQSDPACKVVLFYMVSEVVGS